MGKEERAGAISEKGRQADFQKDGMEISDTREQGSPKGLGLSGGVPALSHQLPHMA
jgi:hypothetical protein